MDFRREIHSSRAADLLDLIQLDLRNALLDRGGPVGVFETTRRHRTPVGAAAAFNLKFTGLTHNFPVDPAV
jgi:hypothetical protein